MCSKNAMQLKCDCLLQKLRLKCTADKRRLGSLQVCSSNAFLLAIAQSKRIFFCDCTAQMHFFAIAQPKRIFFAIWQPKRIFLEEKCDWQSQSHFFAKKCAAPGQTHFFVKKMRRAQTSAFFNRIFATSAARPYRNAFSKRILNAIWGDKRILNAICQSNRIFFAPWKSGKFAYACKRIFHASHMSKVAGNVFFRGRVGDEPGSELRTMFAFVLSFGPCRPASKLAVWVGRSVYVYFWFAGQRWGHRLSEAARQTNVTQNPLQKHHCSLQSKYASRFNTKNERWGCCPTWCL